MGCSESPPPIPPRFVAFAWRYHDCEAAFCVRPWGRARRWTSQQRRAWGLICRLPLPAMVVETTGIPRFLGNPGVDVPCSSTPAGPVGQAIFSPTGAAFRSQYVVGSRDDKFLSGLNDTAHPLAVYASQPGSLPDHARLASGCWPALPGGIGYPLGSDARFSFSCCTSLPRLYLAHTDLPFWQPAVLPRRYAQCPARQRIQEKGFRPACRQAGFRPPR